MTVQEIINEVKAIVSDLLENKIDYNEAMGCLQILANETNIDFTILYNAFYSSKPELYF